MFHALLTTITIVSLLGHSFWGCCEHHRDACDHLHFTAEHDALMADCRGDHDAEGHEHEAHGDGPHESPATDESHSHPHGCDVARCVYIGGNADVALDFTGEALWTLSPCVGAAVAAGVSHPHSLFEGDVSPPTQRRHALLQRWLI